MEVEEESQELFKRIHEQLLKLEEDIPHIKPDAQ